MEDITESKRLEREILHISETERQKIAMDLHDDLCPQLIGIEVMTKILKETLEEDLVAHAEDADKIRTLILDAINKTRQLSRGLSPVNLSARGFDSFLEELAQYAEDVFKISCQLEYDLTESFKDNNIATHIYYIVHEAVHNAVKHSEAENICISLTDNSGNVTVKIKDDGKGFVEPVQPQGMGIKLMEYRAGRIGANLEISKAPKGGTLVLLEIEI